MANEFIERRMICRCGKVCFTKKDAVTKKNWLERRGKEKALRVYQCPKSNGYWHLTSKTFRETFRQDRSRD